MVRDQSDIRMGRTHSPDSNSDSMPGVPWRERGIQSRLGVRLSATPTHNPTRRSNGAPLISWRLALGFTPAGIALSTVCHKSGYHFLDTGRPPAHRVSLSSINDKIFQIMMIRARI